MSVSNIMQTLGDHHRVLMAERIPQIHIFSSDTVEVQNTKQDDAMFQLENSGDPNIELDISTLHPNTTYTGFLQFTIAVTGQGDSLDVLRIQPQYSLDKGSTFNSIENGTREVLRARETNSKIVGSSDNISIAFSFTTTNTPSDNIIFKIQAQLKTTAASGVNVEINSKPYGGAGITTRPPFQLICFH